MTSTRPAASTPAAVPSSSAAAAVSLVPLASPSGTASSAPPDGTTAAVTLTDLPSTVLVAVLSELGEVSAVVRCCTACHVLHKLLTEARWPQVRHLTVNHYHRSLTTALTSWLPISFPGIQCVVLQGCSAVPEGLLTAAAGWSLVSLDVGDMWGYTGAVVPGSRWQCSRQLLEQGQEQDQQQQQQQQQQQHRQHDALQQQHHIVQQQQLLPQHNPRIDAALRELRALPSGLSPTEPSDAPATSLSAAADRSITSCCCHWSNTSLTRLVASGTSLPVLAPPQGLEQLLSRCYPCEDHMAAPTAAAAAAESSNRSSSSTAMPPAGSSSSRSTTTNVVASMAGTDSGSSISSYSAVQHRNHNSSSTSSTVPSTTTSSRSSRAVLHSMQGLLAPGSGVVACRRLQHLELRGLQLSAWRCKVHRQRDCLTCQAPSMLQLLLQRNPHLTHLDLSQNPDLPNPVLAPALQSAPLGNLTTLNLAGCWLVNPAFLARCHFITQLRSLDLSDTLLGPELAELAPRLLSCTQLVLNGCTRIEDTHLQQLTARSPCLLQGTLRHLSLARVTRVTQAALGDLLLCWAAAVVCQAASEQLPPRPTATAAAVQQPPSLPLALPAAESGIPAAAVVHQLSPQPLAAAGPGAAAAAVVNQLSPQPPVAAGPGAAAAAVVNQLSPQPPVAAGPGAAATPAAAVRRPPLNPAPTAHQPPPPPLPAAGPGAAAAAAAAAAVPRPPAVQVAAPLLLGLDLSHCSGVSDSCLEGMAAVLYQAAATVPPPAAAGQAEQHQNGVHHHNGVHLLQQLEQHQPQQQPQPPGRQNNCQHQQLHGQLCQPLLPRVQFSCLRLAGCNRLTSQSLLQLAVAGLLQPLRQLDLSQLECLRKLPPAVAAAGVAAAASSSAGGGGGSGGSGGGGAGAASGAAMGRAVVAIAGAATRSRSCGSSNDAATATASISNGSASLGTDSAAGAASSNSSSNPAQEHPPRTDVLATLLSSLTGRMLTQLLLDGCAVSPAAAAAAAAYCPDLYCLSLVGCPALTNSSLLTITSGCSRLQQLTIGGGSSQWSEHVALRPLTGLTILTMCRRTQVTDQQLQPVLVNNRQLRQLKLAGCYSLTDALFVLIPSTAAAATTAAAAGTVLKTAAAASASCDKMVQVVVGGPVSGEAVTSSSSTVLQADNQLLPEAGTPGAQHSSQYRMLLPQQQQQNSEAAQQQPLNSVQQQQQQSAAAAAGSRGPLLLPHLQDLTLVGCDRVTGSSWWRLAALQRLRCLECPQVSPQCVTRTLVSCSRLVLLEWPGARRLGGLPLQGPGGHLQGVQLVG